MKGLWELLTFITLIRIWCFLNFLKI
jgi:hypothetical protein